MSDSAISVTAPQLGALRSTITIQLHTFHACRLWEGVNINDDNHADESNGRPFNRPGMRVFMSNMHQTTVASGMWDPYADKHMLDIEQAIAKARQTLLEQKQTISAVLSQVPSSISMTDNLSVNPRQFPVISATPLAFQGSYLVSDFDELIRSILLASHVGLIGNVDKKLLIRDAARVVRSVFDKSRRYRFTGLTRADYVLGGAKVLAAIERNGVLSAGILDGTLRSQFSPPLPKAQLDAMNEALATRAGLAAGRPPINTVTDAVPATEALDEAGEEVTGAAINGATKMTGAGVSAMSDIEVEA